VISAEIKVNGGLIGYIYARNVGYSPDKAGYHVYECKIFEPEAKKEFISFNNVEHKRDNGWKKLMETVLYEAIEKEQNDEEKKKIK